MQKLLVAITVAGGLVLVPSLAGATPSPNGPGQPGAPATTCGGPAGNANSTPGGSSSAAGSPFNASGTSGTVYAGNPGTASSRHAASPTAVSQYDIACFQVSN